MKLGRRVVGTKLQVEFKQVFVCSSDPAIFRDLWHRSWCDTDTPRLNYYSIFQL